MERVKTAGMNRALLAGAALGLFACSAPRSANMVRQPASTTPPIAATKTLRLLATTSDRTIPPWVFETGVGLVAPPTTESAITQADFYRALNTTLADSRLFKNVVVGGAADYELDGRIFSEEISNGGLGTATLGVRYRLVEPSSGKLSWSGTLVSECKLNEIIPSSIISSDSISNANECAMRKNLAELVNDLAKLTL